MRSAYPAGWRERRRLVADGDYEDQKALNRFATRFRMASGTRSVAHPDTAPARDEGCSVALRVGRAYTALGAWETIMGFGKQTEIDDEELAGDFTCGRWAHAIKSS